MDCIFDLQALEEIIPDCSTPKESLTAEDFILQSGIFVLLIKITNELKNTGISPHLGV
jgi:hypothetical protein